MIMNFYKEIGGFFGLELNNLKEYYSNLISLNSGRNALRYIVRTYCIKNIYVPYYTCPVIFDALEAENCEISLYNVDEYFMPVKEFPQDAYVLYTNYYGICSLNCELLANKYKNLIVDNAQSFYSPSLGLASFYSPRKFFGIPDGGYLAINKVLNEKLEQEMSYQRCSHLLKRIDLSANAAYRDFKENDSSLNGTPIKLMSNLTKKLLSSIDYESVKQKRLKNFNFLAQRLDDRNELTIRKGENDVPIVYPLLIKDEVLRANLIQSKIYVATYWPEMEKKCYNQEYELYLQKYLLPLPIDQRYGEKEMKFIVEVINMR
jgi:hypothetical protein